MPSFTSVAINDGETSPVEHTFNPKFVDSNGVGKLYETDGVPIGDNQLSVSARETNTGKYKCRLVLQMPQTVSETVNGVSREVVERVAFGDIQLSFDSASTTQIGRAHV